MREGRETAAGAAPNGALRVNTGRARLRALESEALSVTDERQRKKRTLLRASWNRAPRERVRPMTEKADCNHVWVMVEPKPHQYQPRNLRRCAECDAEAFDPPMTDEEYRQRQTMRIWPWDRGWQWF